MKTVTRIDSIKDQERASINQKHQERIQETQGMVKLDGQYLKELSVMVSAEDLTAFRRYRSEVMNDLRTGMTGMKTIYEMLTRRNEIEELIVTESGLLSPLLVRMDTELYDELKTEAQRYNLTLNDYIRSIIYGIGKAAEKRKSDRTKQGMASANYQRFIQIPLALSPETREHLLGKHGQMTDDQLRVKVQELIGDFLNK